MIRVCDTSTWKVDHWKFKLTFILVCFSLLFLRRPMEFIAPYVWAEDGTWNIPHYLDYGFWSLLQPVQGYLILPSKIISAISLKLSFVHYPELSIYLSALFSVFCLYLIAYAPTLLRYKVLCALAVLIIPSNPEVFVLPLYSFWWGTLLIFLALLWNTERKSNALRFFCIILAGLSSPIIILCAPLFILRAAIYRQRTEVIITILIIVISTIQGYFVFTKADMTGVGVLDIVRDIVPILVKFIGQYFYSNISYPTDTLLTFIVVPFLIWCWIRKRKELGFPFLILVCLYAIAILATVKRVSIDIIDPHNAGPRYFFYPFVIFSWTLIWLYSVSRDNQVVKYIFWLLFACILLNSTTKFYRLSESPNWQNEVEYCLNNKAYHFPINLDGQMQNLWHVELTKYQCEKLINESVFDNRESLKKFPDEFVNFTFSDFAPSMITELNEITVIEGTWKMNDQPAEANNLFGQRMLSSWNGSDAFTGQQRLIFNSTETQGRIAYQTGPVSMNQKIIIKESHTQKIVLSTYFKKSDSLAILSFDTKPNTQYEVVLIDIGKKWGEWSAIFIPN